MPEERLARARKTLPEGYRYVPTRPRLVYTSAELNALAPDNLDLVRQQIEAAVAAKWCEFFEKTVPEESTGGKAIIACAF